VSNDWYPLLYQTAKCEQSRLNGPFHGAHNDEAHVEVVGYPWHELLFQLSALFAAELGQLGVMDGVVLCAVLVRTEKQKLG
jgi:hypothetical protein